ncbi:hypothetical protein PsorP6_009902 [Peronosclerospora sorghi]|uniref:Uncharacterized protein n=1 Tax=Peronosclerospora sorghi TaxID=230839 RepID=A0ACC0W2N8_9STRA|nr:hypothetical protein PsorP6_009902 [Peronosclerospora sorghi]
MKKRCVQRREKEVVQNLSLSNNPGSSANRFFEGSRNMSLSISLHQLSSEMAMNFIFIQAEDGLYTEQVQALKDSNNKASRLAVEYLDVFPDQVLKSLPLDRDMQQEIDLMPGAKYFVTRE